MSHGSVAWLLAGERAAGDPVAFARDGSATGLAQFRRDVAWNAARMKSPSCRSALLACVDTYWAAVGLFALFQAESAVALLPGYGWDGLAAYRREGDVIVTDQPGTDSSADDGSNVFRLESAGVPSGKPVSSALVPLDLDRCRLDLFTSGSTAAPKRIGKTLRQLETEAQVIETLFAPRLPAGSKVHATVPHHHLYGLTFGLVWPLLSGRPFGRQMHNVWESVFASHLGGNVLVTSPAHLTRLAGFDRVAPAQSPALILSAGASLPAAAAAKASLVLGCLPTEIFGSTETGAIAFRDWRDAEAPWSPLPGIAVEQAEDGCLTVRSPFIPGPQPYRGADMIELTAGGGFRALGRADDICKIEGKRISLSAVEHELLRLPGIAAAAVLMIDDGQPRLAAVVQLDPAGEVERSKIGSFRFGQLLRRRLAVHLETASLPKRWRFVPALPAHVLGKRRRADLLALFAEPASGDASVAAAIASDEPAIRDQRQSVSERGAACLELDLFIDPALPQLDGHFPDLPIVPGVALVDWAARLAARHLHCGDGVARSLQVKFRRLIQPGKMVTLALEHQPATQRLVFTYRDGNDILASGRFLVPSSPARPS